MKLKKNVKILLWVLLAITLLIALFAMMPKDKASIQDENPQFKHTGKCIDCERQFSANTRWMGQSNKCYDCESDLIARSGGDLSAAYGGVKTKCFDC